MDYNLNIPEDAYEMWSSQILSSVAQWLEIKSIHR